MSRICTLPLTLRQHMVKQLHVNSFNRNLCNSSRLLTKTLTLNAHSELHQRYQTYQNASIFDASKFYTPPINAQNAWRHYGSQSKPPNFNSKPASSGNDDDDHLHEDEELDFIEEEDEPGEYTDHDDGGELDEEYLLNLEGSKKNSVPSTNTVPDYFPKVPMIATAFPVFPKFMKVFEVTDPNLIKLLEWVR